MGHAAKSHDALEAAERARDALRRNEANREKLLQQLTEAEARAELELLLADLSGHLRDVSTKHMSEGQRLRHSGLRARLAKARSA